MPWSNLDAAFFIVRVYLLALQLTVVFSHFSSQSAIDGKELARSSVCLLRYTLDRWLQRDSLSFASLGYRDQPRSGIVSDAVYQYTKFIPFVCPRQKADMNRT